MVVSSDPKPLADNSKNGQSNFHGRLPTAHPASVLLSECLLGAKGWWLPANAMAFGRGVGRDGPANQILYTSNTGLKKTLRAVLQD